MVHASTPANVVRFPPRLRAVASAADGALAGSGIRPGKGRIASGLGSLAGPKTAGGLALDALLSAGTIDGRQHAAGLAYATLRRRYEDVAASYSARRVHRTEAQRDAAKRKHAALLGAVGADRFALDRLCLDGDAPLRCEVERVRAALGRVAGCRCGFSMGQRRCAETPSDDG